MRALAAVATVVLLSGCGGSGDAQGTASRAVQPTPTALGGTAPAQHTPPKQAMDSMERPVAERLARQIAAQGLRLDYLDCPDWPRDVPHRMMCKGYVDGLLARVHVQLDKDAEGVSFDAWLADGVIATRKLEDTLRRQVWTRADCGDLAAYPARPGTRIVCRVSRPGTKRYVVATVRDRAGAVTITDYTAQR